MTAPRFRLVRGAGTPNRPRYSYDVVLDTQTSMAYPFPLGFGAKAISWLDRGSMTIDEFNGLPAQPYELEQVPKETPSPASSTADGTVVRYYLQQDHEGDLCVLDRLSDRVILFRDFQALRVIDAFNDGTRNPYDFAAVSRRFFESPEYRSGDTTVPNEDLR